MKQAAFVVLGLAVSNVLSFSIVKKFPQLSGCSGLTLAFLFVIAISLLFGVIAGFLCYLLLDTKWKLLWIAPGLYIGGIMMIAIVFPSAIFEVVAGEFEYLAKEILHMSLFWLFVYLLSLAGTGSGYFLRGLISPRRKSD